jgi:hypothetical protein
LAPASVLALASVLRLDWASPVAAALADPTASVETTIQTHRNLI